MSKDINITKWLAGHGYRAEPSHNSLTIAVWKSEPVAYLQGAELAKYMGSPEDTQKYIAEVLGIEL